MAQLPLQPPVRLTDPSASQQTQQIHSDIYDKLNRLLAAESQAAAVAAATSSITTRITNNITATSISGATGTAATPQYATIPKLTTVPSNNPTTGAPYAQDGLLIEVNSQFLRYNGTIFQWEEAGTATIILTDTHANRVASFPANLYTNSLFLESDTLLLLESNGTSWLTVAGTVRDTHANRLSTWPSVQFSVNTYFAETNRTVRYWVQNATGTLTVTGGTTVTWVSGHHFINTGIGFNAAQWPAGTAITIAGVVCHVSVVNSATSLTLQLATTNAAGVAYTVFSGRWVYVDGIDTDTYGNLPTDLGENDYNSTTGFQFYDTTHFRLFQWAATGAAPASSTPGWTRGQNELPTGFVSILPFGGGQMATGWSLCNGTAGVSITQDDATTTNVTTPNLIGAYPKGGTVGAYSPTPNTATVPAISGQTADATVGFNAAAAAAAATASPITVQSGSGIVVNSLTSGGGGGGGGSLITDPHHHSLTSADAPITLPGDPVVNVVVPFFMKR